MYTFSEGELMGEVVWMRENQDHEWWFWYRNVLLQAQEKRLIRIIPNDSNCPFWWRHFDESIEILNDRLRTMIQGGSV